jgi:hypothetical protein
MKENRLTLKEIHFYNHFVKLKTVTKCTKCVAFCTGSVPEFPNDTRREK